MWPLSPSDLARITDYVAGELPPHETAETAQWIEERAERKTIANDLRRSQHVLRQRLDQRFDTAAMVEASVRYAEQGRTTTSLRHAPAQRNVLPRSAIRRIAPFGSRSLRRSLGVGFAIAGAAIVIVLARKAPDSRHTTRTYTTDAQQQAILNFDDGSRMTLAPHSVIELQYAGMQRQAIVVRQGEANVEVVHHAGAPFVVRSGSTTIQVLGTEFIVRHMSGTSGTHVAVLDGKIRVMRRGSSDTTVALTRGQMIEVTDSTTHVSSADDLAPGTDWFFRQASVATVLQAVSHWYGYHFRYTDSTLAAKKVTMQVSMRSSIEALEDLERVLEVSLTVTGDTITLASHSPRAGRRPTRIQTYDVWTPTREIGR